jgi:mannose-6-phosphate isomerase
MPFDGAAPEGPADLYDTAFALLGLSWAARLPGMEHALDAARQLSATIDTALRRPAPEEGYREALPAPARREQNPHMHLLEASLALVETCGDAAARERAGELEALLVRRLLDASGGLRELFAADWSPAADDRYEAGHQYEWVWILHERARLAHAPASPAAARLFAKARELTRPDGRIALSHELDGRPRENVFRAWGQTEALKAGVALELAGDAMAADVALASFDRLWGDHLAPAAVEGGWVDMLDAGLAPLSADMPASTGYHVFLALAELMRLDQALG